MQNENRVNFWWQYVKQVQKIVLSDSSVSSKNLSFWRNKVFCKILTYLTPLSLIGLVPSVLISFMNGLIAVGIMDLLAFLLTVCITLVPRIKIEIRKAIFIVVLYCLSITLLYFLPVPAPGLMFLLVITIFSSLIYSTTAAYLTAWMNALICLIILALIYFEIGNLANSIHMASSWIAVSSNLILLCFACVFCLDLLLGGLATSLNDNKHSEEKLQKSFDELVAVSTEQSAILNTLPASIALLDNEGKIIKVNNEWIEFGKSNNLRDSYIHLGKNYIEISEKSLGLGEKDGKQMAKGLQEILRGERDYFSMEYPCDSPTEKRWFKAEVMPFKSNHLNGAVVMHFNISDRKKAETELLLLINNTEESYILLNNDLNIVSFNNQFEKLYKHYFGLEVQKGISIFNYVKPERRDMVASIYKKVLEGNVEKSEIQIPFSSSTPKYFSLKYSPAKDEFENIIGVFVTIVDVTDIKIATAQKEFDRRDKEALINSTDDLIWSVSKDFKLIAANSAFIEEIKKYTGVELKQGDELLKQDIYPAEYLSHWKKLYSRAHTGDSFKIEVYTPGIEGREESWIETSFNPIIINDQIVGNACYSRNITEKKNSELLLKASERRLAEAQTLAKIGNWETDLLTFKVIWSDQTYRIFDAAPDDISLSHLGFISLVHPDDQEKVDTAFKNSLDNKGTNTIEHRVITKAGAMKYVEERWQIIHDKNDVPIKAVGTSQDITESKIAEVEREKLTNDLVQRNRDLEQFTFIISHNLRAPTANIMGITEFLQDETLPKEVQKEMLNGLITSVAGLDNIIKDINSILQVKREVNDNKEKILFSKLVNNIKNSIENTIEKHNVKINCDFSAIESIRSLKVYLHSIFYNLISNSIKYRNPDKQPIIEIKSKLENNNIILTFKDNGLGIDLKTKGDKVFGLYKRFHSHVEGKGMGLFMVKTQVEAIGGKISIKSELNMGTEFTIVFEK